MIAACVDRTHTRVSDPDLQIEHLPAKNLAEEQNRAKGCKNNRLAVRFRWQWRFPDNRKRRERYGLCCHLTVIREGIRRGLIRVAAKPGGGIRFLVPKRPSPSEIANQDSGDSAWGVPDLEPKHADGSP